MSEESLRYQAPDEGTPQNITQHFRAIYAESELVEAATCKPYLQVRTTRMVQFAQFLPVQEIVVTLFAKI